MIPKPSRLRRQERMRKQSRKQANCSRREQFGDKHRPDWLTRHEAEREEAEEAMARRLQEDHRRG